MGKVALVGAGPGDIGLITVKGLNYIKTADCIIYDRLIGEDILMFSKPGCELIYVGKENHHHTLPQDDINELIVQKASEHDFVVRLKGGDPYVFGRGGEEALYLIERGIKFEIVPGISSSIAVPAYAGIPVTHRGIAKGFHVITSHSSKDELMDIDFSLYKDEKETCIFLMGLSHLEEIVQNLIKAGRLDTTKVAVISNGTKNEQVKCVGTLKSIVSLVKDSDITSPAIIVVGEVVGLEDKLSFFENRPLFGRKYALPFILGGEFDFTNGWKKRIENELIDGLKNAGATVLAYKTGEIKPIKCNLDGLASLSEADFMIFTSKNAVNAFMYNLSINNISINAIGSVRIAVVGDKTASELMKFGIIPDVVSEISTGKALAEKLLPQINENTAVLWFCAKETGGSLEDIIADKCQLNKIVCYENVDLDLSIDDESIEIIRDCDGVIFTSASNAKRFCKATMGVVSNDVFSIGPVCRKALENIGIVDVLEADNSTYDELIKLCIRQSK